jgi:shikimate kinase
VTGVGDRPVALVGLRASGKSTVAPLLAAHLGARALDLDGLLARRAAQRGLVAPGSGPGRTLVALGEPGFRQLELEVLEEALSERAVVIACGGGVIEAEGARAALARSARVVWLDPPLSTLVARLERDPGDRPPLSGATDAAGEVERIASRRRPWFEALAWARIDGVAAPERIAEEIAGRLRSSASRG